MGGSCVAFNAIEEVKIAKKDLSKAHELREQYRDGITRLNNKIAELEEDYSAVNRNGRLMCLRSSVSNMEYSLRCICKNIDCIEDRLKKMMLEAEKHDSYSYDETRNCDS
jgi:hypothetical protein